MEEVQAFKSMDGQLYESRKQAELADRCHMRREIRSMVANVSDNSVLVIYRFLRSVERISGGVDE